jgi:hypothetical protein
MGINLEIDGRVADGCRSCPDRAPGQESSSPATRVRAGLTGSATTRLFFKLNHGIDHSESVARRWRPGSARKSRIRQCRADGVEVAHGFDEDFPPASFEVRGGQEGNS